MSQIKTFVFLDLETTGLPYMEHNTTRITELCAVAVQADHIELGCFPRVHNKLSLCFNPNKMISPESTDITGLSNQLLEHQSSFSSNAVDVISKWLAMNQKPLCFVAHNGNRFDYPIFRAEIEKTGNSLPEDLLCIDSLLAFRHIDKHKESVQAQQQEVTKKQDSPQEVPFDFNDDFDKILAQVCDEYERERKLTPEEIQKLNETTPKKQKISSQIQISSGDASTSKRKTNHVREFVSYKLQDVYTRLTSKSPINVHEAEGDVVMLINCAAVYGEKFITYANENSMKFYDIAPMRRGKIIECRKILSQT